MTVEKSDKKRLAIGYQSLYLLNLLLLPAIGFFILAWFFIKNKQQYGWQRIHLYRAFQLSIACGILLFIIPLVIFVLSTSLEASFTVIFLYFVTFHAAFVLIGMLNLARSMAKKLPIF
jgi:hypothetical protein